ncbi:MAG: hypothetical protein J6Y03_04255 [Alphaproteobacteria bacterium]|nr:hypothetical protein [Alphaproteobacteria bacterium]
MMPLVFFLGACVAASLLWIGFIISFLKQGQITSGMSYIVTLMGLFLPLVIVAMSLFLVYLSLEIKRLQLRLSDLIKALKCNVLNDPVAVHEQVGDLIKEKMKEPPAVLNISKDEPITKYQNMELPEDVELRFKE